MRTKIYVLGLVCILLISCGPDFKSKPPTAPLVSQGPNIIFFTATPSTIKLGEKSTLAWKVDNCTSVEIDEGIGKVRPTGSIEVSPSVSTTYTLKAVYQEYNYDTQSYVVYAGSGSEKLCTVVVEK